MRNTSRSVLVEMLCVVQIVELKKNTNFYKNSVYFDIDELLFIFELYI